MHGSLVYRRSGTIIRQIYWNSPQNIAQGLAAAQRRAAIGRWSATLKTVFCGYIAQ